MKKDMKPYVIMGLVALVFIAVLYTAWPSGSMDRVIQVEGEATLEVVPDEAQFSFAVVTEGSSAQVAQDENSKTSNALLAELKKKEVEVETTNYNVNPRYEYENGKRTENGYEVRQTFSVTTKDLEGVGELLSLVVSKGATDVYSVNFMVSDEQQKEMKSRLLKAATSDARNRAQVLAKSAGARVGSVVSLQEIGGNYGGPTYYMARAESVSMDAKVTPEIATPQSREISARVQASFYLK